MFNEINELRQALSRLTNRAFNCSFLVGPKGEKRRPKGSISLYWLSLQEVAYFQHAGCDMFRWNDFIRAK